MAEETTQEAGVEEATVNQAAGLIEEMLGDDLEFKEEEPKKKKTPESKEEDPAEEEEESEEEEETTSEEDEEEEESSEEADEEEDEEPGTELFTIKVNGKESKVTLEELQKGYQRDSDYTQKTQAISAERKELETELSSVRQERHELSKSLQQMNQNADAELKKYQETDWDTLKEEDPDEYREKRADYRELQDAKKQIDEEQKALSDKAKKDFEVQRNKIAKEQSGKFLEHFPSWKKDKAKAKSGMKKIIDYGVSLGYEEDQVNRILDHRHLLILDKARRYDAIKNSDLSKKKLKNVGKYIKTGTNKGKPAKGSKSQIASKAKMQKLKETGNIRDAASAIEDLL